MCTKHIDEDITTYRRPHTFSLTLQRFWPFAEGSGTVCLLVQDIPVNRVFRDERIARLSEILA